MTETKAMEKTMNNNYVPMLRIETITPERAAAILAAHSNIRPVRQSHVQKLVKLMREGNWEMNGETIKFDHAGVLVDGQHRLQAIATSGIPQKLVCVYGVTSRGVDEGRNRTLNDLVPVGAMQSDVRACLSAIARANYCMTGGRDPWSSNNRPTNAEVLDATPVEWWPIYEAAARHSVRQRSVMSSSFGLVLSIAMIGGAEVEMFASEVAKGIGLAANSPAYQLRAWGEGMRARRAGMTWKRASFVVTARAWNAWVRGESISRLSLSHHVTVCDIPEVVVA